MRVRVAGVTADAELADSTLKRAIGLGFSKRKRSMLFDMSYSRRWEVWMLGMSYPITVIFVDEARKVVDVQRAEPLTLNPKSWKLYIPRKPCRYILETPLKLRVGTGCKVYWR